MEKVQFNNEFGGGCFTEGKVYSCNDTHEGLKVIDDNGDEHIIATRENEFNSYDGDSFFKNNFDYV